MKWWEAGVVLLAVAGFIYVGMYEAPKEVEPDWKLRTAAPIAEPACTSEVLNLLDIVAWQADDAAAHFQHVHRQEPFKASRYQKLAEETRKVRNGCLGHGVE